MTAETSNARGEWVLERLRGVLEHGKMGDKCLIAPDLVTAAIAALSAPQPPAEAHCATCSCVPGMTPAVRFDTTPAEKEGAVRDHLIRMGWTPPAEAQRCTCPSGDGSLRWPCPAHPPEAQPVGAVRRDTGVTITLDRLPYYKGVRLASGTKLYAHPPPSSPVGVEGVEAALQNWLDWCNEHHEEPEARSGARIAIEAIAQQPVAPTWIGIDWAEGQQPAAVDEAMVERACKAAVAQCSPNEVWPDDYSEADDLRAMMQAALAAALAGQQGDKK